MTWQEWQPRPTRAMRTSKVLLLLLGAASQAAAVTTVVVTAATGKVGYPLFQALRRADDVRAVALVRDGEKLRAMDPTITDEDTILTADYCDRAAVDAALAQLDGGGGAGAGGGGGASFNLYLACGNGPAQQEAELNVLGAAAATGMCGYVCKLSTVGAVLEMKSAGPYEAHLAIEEALAGGTIPHAILRPQMFMQMTAVPVVGIGDQLASGSSRCSHPFADMAISMIDAEDVARVAAALLTGGRRQEDGQALGQTLDLTGPAAVSYADLAECISSLPGRSSPIECVPADFDEHAPAPPLARFLEVLGSVSAVTDEVERVTGRPPTSLKAYVEGHPELFAT